MCLEFFAERGFVIWKRNVFIAAFFSPLKSCFSLHGVLVRLQRFCGREAQRPAIIGHHGRHINGAQGIGGGKAHIHGEKGIHVLPFDGKLQRARAAREGTGAGGGEKNCVKGC